MVPKFREVKIDSSGFDCSGLVTLTLASVLSDVSGFRLHVVAVAPATQEISAMTSLAMF